VLLHVCGMETQVWLGEPWPWIRQILLRAVRHAAWGERPVFHGFAWQYV